jgi:integrase
MAKVKTPKWESTRYPGVRFRQWKPRKATGKNDKYFSLRYTVDGKQLEHGLGWQSEKWNAKKASDELASLKKAQVTGEGARTLVEKREQKKERIELKKAKLEKEDKESLTFKDIFEGKYLPQAKTEKSLGTCFREDSLFKLWIEPTIGDLPLKDISPFHLEKIKQHMNKKGRAPRTVMYSLAIIRQVFNYAFRNDLFNGDNPVSKVKKPKFDNKRLRFLTKEEADALLIKLKSRSHQLHDISLVSLDTGARADEVFSLKWGDVDLDEGILRLWDTKNTETRIVHITKRLKDMFAGLRRRGNNKLVFPDKKGKKIIQVSNSFNKAVDELKLNEGVMDRRMKVIFHTLRHTFASWHAQNGTDLYTLQGLLGQKSFSMVTRYAHLSPKLYKGALENFENAINGTQKAEVVPIQNVT